MGYFKNIDIKNKEAYLSGFHHSHHIKQINKKTKQGKQTLIDDKKDKIQHELGKIERRDKILRVKQTIRNLHELDIEIPNKLLDMLHRLVAPNTIPHYDWIHEDVPF